MQFRFAIIAFAFTLSVQTTQAAGNRRPPTFTSVAELISSLNGDVAWGDMDADGDLDLALVGLGGSANPIARVYRNDRGVFTDVIAGLPGVWFSSIAWGDMDGDGDLDLALAGDTYFNGVLTRVYRNDKGTFVDTAAGLPGVSRGDVAWGDVDGDGDLDLALSGTSDSGPISRVYRNEAGAFTDTAAPLVGVGNSDLAWGDIDGDGDLDLVLSGTPNSGGRLAVVYRNSSGALASAATLTGVSDGDAAWGDIDADGDLDLALSGTGVSGPVSRVYRNTNGTFVDMAAGLPGLTGGSVAWGDADNDGDLDLALSGTSASGAATRVYRNDGGGTLVDAGIVALGLGAGGRFAWGDIDGDGDLDFVVGPGGSPGPTRVYLNDGLFANARPAPPKGLQVSLSLGAVTFSWAEATDDTTPAAALSYNVYVETADSARFVVVPHSRASDGGRLVPERGNAGSRLTYTVRGLTAGEAFRWSVQAVDQGFAASAFSPAIAFTAPSFTTSSTLPGVYGGGVAWGDMDGDGDLDLAISGETATGGAPRAPITRVYRNDGGDFTDAAVGLPGTYAGTIAWADADGDGDLDLAVTGYTGSDPVTRVYRNTAGAFADAGVGLAEVYGGTLAWGDIDGDGDLDLAISGIDPFGNTLTRVYRNTGGTFADTGAGLPGMRNGGLAWGDFDGDGDLDLAITGLFSILGPTTRVYRNTGGTFADANAGLPGLADSAVSWGDYDGDGDADLAVCGISTTGVTAARIYRNNAGNLTDIAAGLQGAYGGSVAWGDVDGDGDLDLALTGQSGPGGGGVPVVALARVYRNDGGVFTDANAGLAGVNSSGGLAWGDVDSDGDLDLVVSGSSSAGLTARVYESEGLASNGRPSAPGGLAASVAASSVTLSWMPAADDSTPEPALSYNVYVEAPDGTRFVVPPQALAAGTVAEPDTASDGRRIVPAVGNAGQRRSYSVRGLGAGVTYRWSVQAVDQGFAGGPFAAAGTFVVGAVGAEPGTMAFPMGLDIAPNPATGHVGLTLRTATPSAVRVAVFDALGREVALVHDGPLRAGTHALVLDAGSLPPGVYVVRALGGGQRSSRMLAIVR